MSAASFPLPESESELPISAEALELPTTAAGATRVDDSWLLICTVADRGTRSWVETTLAQLNIPSVLQPREFQSLTSEQDLHPQQPVAWQVLVPKQFARLASDALHQLLGSTET